MHVHNERNFPKAKLDSETNARFLWNEHGDLYRLLHNDGVYIIVFNLRKKYWAEEKNVLDGSVHKTGTLRCKPVDNSLDDVKQSKLQVTHVTIFSEVN